ncbi:Hypothetical predicted protein [Octopus vulgaris]|uniref:Uncharacterized protein n=1 Tax=Octopus vulgaris TaxID=6645 RepID=A0AA36AZC5_OCTVU|nr:Hypothetical predicted protein [Octopus vulgaris]
MKKIANEKGDDGGASHYLSSVLLRYEGLLHAMFFKLHLNQEISSIVIDLNMINLIVFVIRYQLTLI